MVVLEWGMDGDGFGVGVLGDVGAKVSGVAGWLEEGVMSLHRLEYRQA